MIHADAWHLLYGIGGQIFVKLLDLETIPAALMRDIIAKFARNQNNE
jgi:hypothetical protein